MPVNMDSAIADLKVQFEQAVASWQVPGDPPESVHVEQAAKGQWLFWLHILSSIECRLDPPRSLWLANKRISTREPDLSLAGARYRGEHLLVLVEAKSGAADRLPVPEFDWLLLRALTKPSDLFADPVRNVAAKRSLRALLRILRNVAVHTVEDVASQSSDLAVVIRALEQPEAIEMLAADDPLARARLRGLRERERLLSEEGGTWTAEQVAKHLRLTRQTVNLRRKHGSLLGLDAGRHGFRYPAWQFARTGTIGGLERTLAALEHLDPWMQQAFMLSRSARLKDERAIDVLRAGDVSSVVKAASAFGEHGAA
jgi:hypothetical protein